MERDGFEVSQGGKWYAYVSLLQADVIRGFVKCGIIMYDMIFKHPSTHTHTHTSADPRSFNIKGSLHEDNKPTQSVHIIFPMWMGQFHCKPFGTVCVSLMVLLCKTQAWNEMDTRWLEKLLLIYVLLLHLAESAQKLESGVSNRHTSSSASSLGKKNHWPVKSTRGISFNHVFNMTRINIQYIQLLLG